MNTPTHVTLTNSLVNPQTRNTHTNELVSLPDEVLFAKNIQLSKNSIVLDVFVNKNWQTLRLGTADSSQKNQKIISADIQLDQQGKTLSINPKSTTLTVEKPGQLQRLINYVSSGAEIESKPLSARVVLSPSAKLVIDKLNANIAINKDVAQLLSTETPLKVKIDTTNKGAQLNVINRFSDTIYSQPLSLTKLTTLLAATLPNGQLQATPKLAIFTHSQNAGSFTLPITNNQLSTLPSTPVDVNITSLASKLLIKTVTNNITVMLNNSFSKPFSHLLTQQNTLTPQAPPPQTSVSLSANSPIASWLENSLSDLKTRISDAVKYFENKPFSTDKKTTLNALSAPVNNKVMLLPPLLQLTERLKTSINTSLQGPQQNLLTSTDNSEIALLPLEKRLLEPLLKHAHSFINTQQLSNKTLLSNQINDIKNNIAKTSPDLTQLVNQAFNRMISSNNLHPSTIEREILAALQPSHLNESTLRNSFTQGLEQLSVSILAAPLINHTPSVSLNQPNNLDSLLQVLLPAFKTGNMGAKLLEQLQQPQIQALSTELTQIKNTLTQVQFTSASQQPDSNPLAQFLLPMKLPTEASQTEITLGQYKKQSRDKAERKDVWFVRLNFDYADLGKLQITAELMGKALDCQLLASSQQVTKMAHPHLVNLRAKLAKHGLQVGELNLKQGTEKTPAFYKSHAIINIKV